MGNRAAKTALFDAFAQAAKALASGRRIELLDVLANGERTVEAHLFGLDSDIYGEAITVRLHHRLRDELRFESLIAMKARIAIDKEESLRALADL